MATVILDPSTSDRLIRERQEKGLDSYDEVWEGVYVMPPIANLDHQDQVGRWCAICVEVIEKPRLGRVQPGANVSDREENLEYNFRVPDVVVVLNGGKARDCGTHWFGGPDFLLEIASPGDRTNENITFYEHIETRELLIVDRDSRALSLYRLSNSRLRLDGQSRSSSPQWLQSDVLPLKFRWAGSRAEPHTEVVRTGRKRGRWIV